MAEKEIKNLKKAAERIQRACHKKEPIVLYGDADLDGTTSVIILKETIKNLGGIVKAVHFPDREEEGYGLTEISLKALQPHAPALLITLDCGIGNIKEVGTAKKMGFEVIIIDHHEVLDTVPEADIIVDPKQQGDVYPFKQLANVGLTFKLAEQLLQERLTDTVRKNFLELVALATIADMMPREDENEEMIREGLYEIKTSWRPGLQVLFELEPFRYLDLIEQVYKVNSLLNIRDVKHQLPTSFRMLTCTSKEEAQALAEQLLEKGRARKIRIRDITQEVEDRMARTPSSPIVFEGSRSWELILLGVVASIITKKYQRPIFLYTKKEHESQGSIRTSSGYNVVEAMKSCSKNLITYGGHPQAAGFRIENKYLDEFEECLVEYFASQD